MFGSFSPQHITVTSCSKRIRQLHRYSFSFFTYFPRLRAVKQYRLKKRTLNTCSFKISSTVSNFRMFFSCQKLSETITYHCLPNSKSSSILFEMDTEQYMNFRKTVGKKVSAEWWRLNHTLVNVKP